MLRGIFQGYLRSELRGFARYPPFAHDGRQKEFQRLLHRIPSLILEGLRGILGRGAQSAMIIVMQLSPAGRMAPPMVGVMAPRKSVENGVSNE